MTFYFMQWKTQEFILRLKMLIIKILFQNNAVKMFKFKFTFNILENTLMKRIHMMNF